MKRETAYLLLSFLVLFASCSKDPVKEKEFFYMDSEFRDHTFFKPGSWWIYKKDTLTQDSVAVLNSSFILQEPDSAEYSWQQSRMQYSSSYYNDTTTLLGDFIKPSAVFYLKQVKDSSEILNFFSLKPAGYVLNLSPSLQMRYRELKDTTLNGQAFGSVRIFENLVTPTDLTLPKVLWYVKNTGIIRKELFNGEIWYLDRFNVVQ